MNKSFFERAWDKIENLLYVKYIRNALIALVILAIIGFAVRIFALEPADVADDYIVSLAYESNGNTYIDKYSIELESSGLFYVYENRNIGGDSFKYPSLIGSYYINNKDNVVLNVDGEYIELEQISQNSLVGLKYGIALNFTAEDACVFDTTCEYSIVGKSTVEEEKAKYYISSNSSSCRYDVSVDKGMLNVEYTQQGDAIVEVYFTNLDNQSVIELKAGNVVKNIKYIKTVERTLQ